MKEKQHKPSDLVETQLPETAGEFNSPIKNVPQVLWEASKVLEGLMTRRDAQKRRRK